MNCFGNHGRLGNQIFQAAFLKSVQELRGLDVYTPGDSAFHELFEAPWKSSNKPHQTFSIKESSLKYDESLLLVPNNTDITGYFQSEFYFNGDRDQTKKWFKFNRDLLKKSYRFTSELSIDPSEYGCIHIRQGDYIKTNAFYNIPTIEYYLKAAKESKSNKFLVFSDSVLSDEDNKKLKEYEFKYINTDPLVSFIVMTQCESHVISSSTYSWWASYLSNSDRCYCPEPWYGKQGPGFNHLEAKHLVPVMAETKA